ncbi:MAG: hypothetical protein SNJ77_00105 [Cytophagales bacterium]
MKINKTIVFLVIAIFSVLTVWSQTKATTADGKKVLLFDDKTWKYESEGVSVAKPIPTSEKKYFKSPVASTQLKSKKNGFSLFIDSKKWDVNKTKFSKDAEFNFQLKDKMLFAMMINEKIDIGIESLKEVAIANAKNAATSVTVVNEEYRFVNGVKVLMLQMRCEIQNMDFTYLSYYYSASDGCVQLISYTYTNTFNEFKSTAEELLNGLVVN